MTSATSLPRVTADETEPPSTLEPGSAQAATQLAEVARFCHAQGWVRATSGNFSARVGETRVLISASGRDKGSLTQADFLVVDLLGRPERPGGQPSAETPLHCALYRRPGVEAVAHTHSVAATVLSR